jgi:hypothetical protein
MPPSANRGSGDGVLPLLLRAYRRFPFIERGSLIRLCGREDGQGGSRHPRLGDRDREARTDKHRFVPLPKRWIVERTLAWVAATGASRATSSATPAPSPQSRASP